jgi:hypothetical protein
VAAAVEPAVDPRLDAAAQWLEHRGHGQGGRGHHQAGVALRESAESEDDAGVAAAQQQREQPAGDRAADDAVQVVQPIA